MLSKSTDRPAESRGGRKHDRGDTLVEVLVALTIIGLCVVPLLNSLIESFTGSTEHRSIATIDTLLKSFAESAKSQIELNAPTTGGPYTSCSTTTGGANYQLLSAPSPATATAGTAVTVFGTGFHSGVSASSFKVTVGGSTAPVLTSQSQQTSDSSGNMQLTFTVPSVAVGAQTITVSDQQNPTPTMLTSVSGMGLTVSSGSAGPETSAESGYTMGIQSVQYLDSDNGTFESCSAGSDVAATLSGIEKITLLATAPTGDSDTLSFVVRNPAFVATSIPTPSVVVQSNLSTGTISRPTAPATVTVTFTATVEPPSSNPQATGTVTWTGCTKASQTTGSPNTIVTTCTTTISSTTAFGADSVTASYGGDAYNKAASGTGAVTVYASDGSGSIAPATSSEIPNSTGNTQTYTYTAATGGMNNGEVDIAVPAGWTAPQTTSSSSAGYTTSSAGAAAVNGRTIQVTGLTLGAGQTVTITYGAGGGTAGVTAPASGSYTFTTSEKSTINGTLTSLATSPTVTVSAAVLVNSGSAITGKTVSTPITASPSVTYVIYAFTSNSGSGDTATLSAAGFTGTPTQALINSEDFDGNGSNLADHAWAWYVTGYSGSGTFTVTFTNTIKNAFLDVVQLNGNSTPPIVVSTEGTATSKNKTASNPATANLSGTPSSSDPELIFLATEGDFGATAPTLSNNPSAFLNLVSTDTATGSRAIYTGTAQATESLTMGSNQQWGTMALEING